MVDKVSQDLRTIVEEFSKHNTYIEKLKRQKELHEKWIVRNESIAHTEQVELFSLIKELAGIDADGILIDLHQQNQKVLRALLGAVERFERISVVHSSTPHPFNKEASDGLESIKKTLEV